MRSESWLSGLAVQLLQQVLHFISILIRSVSQKADHVISPARRQHEIQSDCEKNIDGIFRIEARPSDLFTHSHESFIGVDRGACR